MPQITKNTITWTNKDFYGGFAPNTQAAASTTDIRKLGAGFTFAKKL